MRRIVFVRLPANSGIPIQLEMVGPQPQGFKKLFSRNTTDAYSGSGNSLYHLQHSILYFQGRITLVIIKKELNL
jgi:hypothetical protein